MNRGELLQAGLQRLAINLPEQAVAKLLMYVDLLVKWNGTYT